MSWDIITFETQRGEKPVDEFIKRQQPQARSKIVHNIRLLRQYGNMLGMPHSRMLVGGLYELRIRGKEELRIFYCFKKRTMYLRNKHRRHE